MPCQVVFETHSLSEDNERGVASGWNHSRLSERGRSLAAELGERRRNDGIEIVFASDLERARETARIAFANSSLPVLCDWRLRECNYGDWNGMPATEMHAKRARFLEQPYPGGESWRQAIRRVERFLDDLREFWHVSRVLVIGHVATRWAFDHLLNGTALERLVETEFGWREGWEYLLV